jgi:S-adenosylmethionine:tRNA ribosyltransferase-isomerase
VGGASKWKPGTPIEKEFRIGEKEIGKLSAKMIEKNQGSFLIELDWAPNHLSFVEVLQYIGAIPLPPYIKREVAAADADRYQTVYAKEEGSVAAPTAGLHFTTSLLNELKKKGIQERFITLHVGAGTFKQVKSETMEGHQMHEEWIEIEISFLKDLLKELKQKAPIVAAGTTSLRTIESLYWMGIKICQGENEIKPVSQWDPYTQHEESFTSVEAIEALINWLERNACAKLISKTALLIMPGYSFKIVEGLITNFHQPQSTLLLLVAAFIGPDWKKVYNHALNNNYRFLSYGDGCLLWKN